MVRYQLFEFLRCDQITIAPTAQRAPYYPFTLAAARHFFGHFEHAVFEVQTEVPVRSIYITSGKNALPRHSFAHGFLLSVSLEAYEAHGLSGIPDPLGAIHLEYGGNTTSPTIWTTLTEDRTLAARPGLPSPPFVADGIAHPLEESPARHKKHRWLVPMALVILAVSGLLVATVIGHHDHSGLTPVGKSQALAASTIPIVIAWAHDLGFSWWQPVYSGGEPIWLNRGDLVWIQGTDGTPHKYASYRGGDPISFGWHGVWSVEENNKRGHQLLLNQRAEAKVLGLQARTYAARPPLGGRNTACDVTTTGTVAVSRPGFLYLCPNVPNEGGLWECSGTCELTITVHTKDGSLSAPKGIAVPRMYVILGSNGSIRSNPSLQSGVAISATAGTRVECVGRSGAWYHVRVDSGAEPRVGWVQEALVSMREVR